MVDFNTKNNGTWFFFDDDNEDLGGVCLRELSMEESRKIDKITTKDKPKFQSGKWETEKVVNEKQAQELTFGYCIVDWKNVCLDGASAECNIGNKVKAMKSLDFVKFVLSCLGQLKSQNTAISEARLKNSESSSSGQ